MEVDLGALQRNAQAIARHSGARLLPVIKADAYGLGAIPVARVLAGLDPWGFGVATLGEARALREAGFTQRLLVLTPLLPREYAAARALDATPSLGAADSIVAWRDAGGGAYHLGIDTGMSRAGVRWTDVPALAPLLAELPPEGAFTHFHSAELVDGSVDEQTRRFADAVRAMPVRPAILHAENSAAVAHLAGPSSYVLVRPGIYLYGVSCGGSLVPEPVVALRAPVVETRALSPGDTVSYDATFRATKPMRIATAAVGYADGYRRALSNRGVALLSGRRVPVLGLVTMDMTMFDVSDVPCQTGDVLTLIGSDHAERLDVADVARVGELSPYELLTGLRLRGAHVYTGTPS